MTRANMLAALLDVYLLRVGLPLRPAVDLLKSPDSLTPAQRTWLRGFISVASGEQEFAVCSVCCVPTVAIGSKLCTNCWDDKERAK